MKTKNMRKKALVSSLAMLLVAVIAIGGATFAWWTTNNSVSASDITLSTTSGSSLMIAEGNGSTKPEATAFKNTVDTSTWKNLALEPVSSTFCQTETGKIGTPTFFDVTVAQPIQSYENRTSQAVSAINSLSSATKYVKKTIWMYNNTSCDVYVSTMNIVAGTTPNVDITPAIRIGFCPDSQACSVYKGGTPGSTYAVLTGDTEVTTTFGNMYAGTASTGGTETFYDMSTDLRATSSTANIVHLNAGYANAVRIDLYIWLEGNDSYCDSSIAGGIVTDLDLGFTIASGT